jgi:hypothetical protein
MPTRRLGDEILASEPCGLLSVKQNGRMSVQKGYGDNEVDTDNSRPP